jgi:Flp pilus assembly protein TadG
MNAQTKRHLSSRHHQRGVVGVIFGIVAVFVLFGMMGWAMELSQTYDRKTELQNAADAAVLAGAKRLNGTTAGVTAAVTDAQAMAANHRFKFGTTVALAGSMIRFSNSAETADALWIDQAAAEAAPAGLLFMKIDTSADPIYGRESAPFMSTLLAGATTNTFGRAVAGRATTGLAPIAICAINPTTKYGSLPHPAAPPTYIGLPAELLEYGFRRGVGYNILDLNPGGSTKYLLDGFDIPGIGACIASNNNTVNMRPLMCSGSVAFTGPLPTSVFNNTGMSASLDTQINSRFDVFPPGGTACNPAATPPDSNIRQYTAGTACTGAAANGKACKWMTPAPPAANQTATTCTTAPNNCAGATLRTKADVGFAPTTPAGINITAPEYGVLWAYTPAVQYAASPPATGYTPYAATAANWASLYRTTSGVQPAPITTATGYPTAGTPYTQTAGQYFSAPSRTGISNRRVLNVAIIRCTPAIPSGSCNTMPVLGVGKFFQTVQSNVPNTLSAEFGGLVPDGELGGEVRLFK